MTKSLHQTYVILQPKSGRDLFFFNKKGEIADLYAVIIYCVWFIHFLYWRLMAWNVTETPFIVWNSAGMWRGATALMTSLSLAYCDVPFANESFFCQNESFTNRNESFWSAVESTTHGLIEPRTYFEFGWCSKKVNLVAE